MANNAPIGIYDSGLGGLTVWREVRRLLPHEALVYLGDGKNCPYGSRPKEEIRALADEAVGTLVAEGCKLVVVACNTATAAAISYLRSHYPVPFVGMEPAVKPAALTSRTGVVGVLATANTFKGSLYRDTVMKYASGIHIVEKVGRGLVEAVERGEVPSELIRRYVGEMTAEGADVIVLGCTHFPFLQEEVERAAGPGVRIINPAPAVARQTARVLHSPAEGGGTAVFYSTGDTTVLKSTVLSIDPAVNPGNFYHVTI